MNQQEIFKDMHQHSNAYAQIVNIIALANHHRETCNSSDCQVSLYLLENVARRLIPYVWDTEKQDIILKVTSTNWF